MTKMFRAIIIYVLLAIIVTSGIIAWSKYRPSAPLEISLSSSTEVQGNFSIGGAVHNPGIYPLTSGITFETIIQTAGGTTDNADLDGLKIYIPEVRREIIPQRVDINRAESWLLQALPGIGETKAQAIVVFRERNGPFRNITELIKVEGIGLSTFEQIKDLITVSD